MKTILVTMAAVSALGLAVPAAGQPWNGNRPQSDGFQSQIEAGVRSGAISRSEAMPLRDNLRRLIQLERRFGPGGYTGRENAALSQRSALLRRQIGMAERSGYSRDRNAGWQDHDDDERQARWDDRSDNRPGSIDRNDVERDSRWGERSGERARPGDRDDIERYARWDDRADGRDRIGLDGGKIDTRFGQDNRGDRFAGDVRVGQAASARMIALPERYRDRFQDDDRVYYRYDDRRIYQVDRRNGLILGLLDLVN